ncbi:leucine-rich repeat domain-containing protein, partial [Kitasatospora sp. NPDC093558]
MTVNEHIREFHGLPVFDFVEAVEQEEATAGSLPGAGAVAWKIGLDFESEGTFAERWQRFLDTVDVERVSALVLGQWFSEAPEGLEEEALTAIVASAHRLPALRALFVGDITYEESEISWLEMCDVTPLLTAFPRLTELVVRGGTDLALKPVRHDALTALRFEAGGLPAEV